MKDFLKYIVSTQRGWIIRQAIKYCAMGSAALATWLAAKGLDENSSQALAAGIAAGVSGLVELLLSKAASKIAAE